MKSLVFTFSACLLLALFCSFASHGQAPPAPSKGPAKTEKVRTIGKAEVFWVEQKNETVASVLVYLVGAWKDVSESKDVLQLFARYRSKGRKVEQPEQVELALSSHSKLKKYAGENQLTLVADGATILSRAAEPVPYASSETEENFDTAIGYADFIKFITAKKPVLKFGSHDRADNGDDRTPQESRCNYRTLTCTHRRHCNIIPSMIHSLRSDEGATTTSAEAADTLLRQASLYHMEIEGTILPRGDLAARWSGCM